MSEIVFFFRGSRYVAVDGRTGRAEPGGPRPIAGDPRWPGFDAAGFGRDLQAVLPLGPGLAHVFRGRVCLVAHVVGGSLRAGTVHRIVDLYPGLADTTFADGLDAAVDTGPGVAFLFRGTHYVRYDLVHRQIAPGYPAPIVPERGPFADFVAAGFTDGVDAALNGGDGTLLFFRGTRYLRYDLATGRVDDGYPRPIAARWRGLADTGFASGIRAVLALDRVPPGATPVR